METAGSVLKSALQEILVQASEAPLEDDEYQDALKYMNRYMNSLAARGVNLGYTVVNDLSDDITIPDGAIMGLVLNTARYIAPQFDRPPPDARNVRDAEFSMYAIAVQIKSGRYPGTLPLGSGNEQEVQGDQHFYPETDNQILTEQTGPILLEESTE